MLDIGLGTRIKKVENNILIIAIASLLVSAALNIFYGRKKHIHIPSETTIYNAKYRIDSDAITTLTWNLVGGAAVLCVVWAFCFWWISGTIYSQNHPAVPKSAAQIEAQQKVDAANTYVNDCRLNDGVANTQVTPWTCQK